MSNSRSSVLRISPSWTRRAALGNCIGRAQRRTRVSREAGDYSGRRAFVAVDVGLCPAGIGNA